MKTGIEVPLLIHRTGLYYKTVFDLLRALRVIVIERPHVVFIQRLLAHPLSGVPEYNRIIIRLLSRNALNHPCKLAPE